MRCVQTLAAYCKNPARPYYIEAKQCARIRTPTDIQW